MNELEWFNNDLGSRMIEKKESKLILITNGSSRKRDSIRFISPLFSMDGQGFLSEDVFINYEIVKRMLSEQETVIKKLESSLLAERVGRSTGTQP